MSHPKLAAIAPIDTCWAIEPAKAEMYLERIAETPMEACLAKEAEVFAAASAKLSAGEKEYRVENGTAFLSLYGPMTKHPTSMSWLIGGTSTLMLRDAIRSAVADDSVQRLLMEVDSPGGQVTGTEELAAEVMRAAAIKPFIAAIVGDCCSAALWAVAGATKIYALNTSTVGSIGVRTAPIVDSSRKLANEGVTVHSMALGEHKAVGERGVPVTESQLEAKRDYMKSVLSHFVAGVAAGRGMDEGDVWTLATGQTWTGDKAVSLGLVDAIASLDDVLSMINQFGTPVPARGAAHSSTKTTAQASSAPVKEKTMNLKEKVKALLQGNPDAAAEAGITESDFEETTTATVDPAIQTRLSALEAENKRLAEQQQAMAENQIVAHAQSFADGVIRSKKAFPAEREAIQSLFTSAAKSDGAKFENGKLTEGANLAAVRKAYEDRPAHKLDSDAIPNANPTTPNAVDAQDAAPDPERQKALLKMTAIGRRALMEAK